MTSMQQAMARLANLYHDGEARMQMCPEMFLQEVCNDIEHMRKMLSTFCVICEDIERTK